MQLVQAPRDLDYVENFQGLSKVNLEIRRHGPSAERLMEKCRRERDVGNHVAALAAAQDALGFDDKNPEMHYEAGLGYLCVALAKAGVLPVGPGIHALPNQPIATLLRRGEEEFRAVLLLNPRDQDARDDLHAVLTILEQNATDRQLLQALRENAN